jgi:hypothetical protein
VTDIHPAAWYPYRSGGAGKCEGWGSLAKWERGEVGRSYRRYWDGTRWTGPEVSNGDVLFVGTCGRCEKSTAFITLSQDDSPPYTQALTWDGFMKGATFRWLSGIKDEFVVKCALPIKCVQCSQHKALCPYCGTLNVACPGFSTCKNCSGKYQINPHRADLPAGVGFLAGFVDD